MRPSHHLDHRKGRVESVPAISHPLWARPTLLSAICIGLIAYGSLLPFDLDWPSGFAEWQALPVAPQWVEPTGPMSSFGLSASASDLLINLLLYVPLGVVLRFSFSQRGRLGMFSVPATILCILALSWTLESLQSLSLSRVASRGDVLANVLAGGTAAWVCRTLWQLTRQWVFNLYCRTAGVRYRLILISDICRRQTWPTVLIVTINSVLIALWYIAQVSSYISEQGGKMPFAKAFGLPYDDAAVLMGRSMLIYVGLGTLVLLALASRGRRVRLGWVVVTVVGLSVAAEAHRAATFNARPDITDPILAAAAGTLMALTLYCFSLAVRKANRRHRQRPFDGEDRRRMDYRYPSPDSHA